jgi:hypothetical protein
MCGSLAQAQSAEGPQRCGEEPSETLLVFVGRKLDLKPVSNETPPGFVSLDLKYFARYQILHVLCGVYPSDTIAFEVYDHYGTPAFAEFETVLLYVSRYGDRLVHQKYMYDPVYETIAGDWAGCGDPYALDKEHRGGVRATPVRFKTEVSFPIANLTDAQARQAYPSEYFERRGTRVVCTAGASIQDLFAIKRDGFLRARGIFK